MKLDLSLATWINPPRTFEVTPARVSITTEPNTDFWQRSYYGFRNENAPALLLTESRNFSFSVTTRFASKTQFDQSGIFVYLDDQNWCKASIEYENSRIARLGSVVTNNGFSDWATTDISPVSEYRYRISRRGPDFLIESAQVGTEFKQMRICHLHALGDTDENPAPLVGDQENTLPVKFGVYACSPNDSSFNAEFYDFDLQPSVWRAHQAP